MNEAGRKDAEKGPSEEKGGGATNCGQANRQNPAKREMLIYSMTPKEISDLLAQTRGAMRYWPKPKCRCEMDNGRLVFRFDEATTAALLSVARNVNADPARLFENGGCMAGLLQQLNDPEGGPLRDQREAFAKAPSPRTWDAFARSNGLET